MSISWGEECELRATIERLRSLLNDAADDIEHWGGYASEYFKDKWSLEDDIKKYRDAALVNATDDADAKATDQPTARTGFDFKCECGADNWNRYECGSCGKDPHRPTDPTAGSL